MLPKNFIKIGLLVAAAIVGMTTTVVADQGLTCGTITSLGKSGDTHFKPKAAHFSGAVVIERKGLSNPKTGSTIVQSVSFLPADGSPIPLGLRNCKLKSTGFCPGWKECLGVATYLCNISGYKFFSKYGAGVIRFKYKKAILSKVAGHIQSVTCEDYAIPNPRCRTPCTYASIHRFGEYHHPSCNLSYPKCLTKGSK